MSTGTVEFKVKITDDGNLKKLEVNADDFNSAGLIVMILERINADISTSFRLPSPSILIFSFKVVSGILFVYLWRYNMIEMVLLDLSNGFWEVLKDYLSYFSFVEICSIVLILSGMATLFFYLVYREYNKDQKRFH